MSISMGEAKLGPRRAGDEWAGAESGCSHGAAADVVVERQRPAQVRQGTGPGGSEA